MNTSICSKISGGTAMCTAHWYSVVLLVGGDASTISALAITCVTSLALLAINYRAISRKCRELDLQDVKQWDGTDALEYAIPIITTAGALIASCFDQSVPGNVRDLNSMIEYCEKQG